MAVAFFSCSKQALVYFIPSSQYRLTSSVHKGQECLFSSLLTRHLVQLHGRVGRNRFSLHVCDADSFVLDHWSTDAFCTFPNEVNERSSDSFTSNDDHSISLSCMRWHKICFLHQPGALVLAIPVVKASSSWWIFKMMSKINCVARLLLRKERVRWERWYTIH